MKFRRKIFVLGVFFLSTFLNSANASVIINELLADPPSGITGDANHDGVGSTTQDEFVELLNLSSSPINISGWFINDAISKRHTFPVGTTMLAYQYLTIFGGGSPNLPGINFQLASSGTLSLNNTNEQVFLYDQGGHLIDHVSYGAEGGKDQSLVRFPEGTGSQFALHASIPEAKGKRFSPGTKITGETAFQTATAVPELPGWMSFVMGGGIYYLRRKLMIAFV